MKHESRFPVEKLAPAAALAAALAVWMTFEAPSMLPEQKVEAVPSRQLPDHPNPAIQDVVAFHAIRYNYIP